MQEEKIKSKAGACCVRNPMPTRWTLAFMAMAVITISYSFRTNLSLAIVCMVNKNATSRISVNSTNVRPSSGEHCGELATKDGGYMGEFYWSNDLQGHLLSSLFYGYTATQVIGGWLCDKFGGKHILGLGLLISIIANMLIPVCARINPYIVIGLRVIIGMGSGVLLPGMNSLWACWAPPLERARLMSLTIAGNTIGSIITLAISGFLCSTNIDGGWPLIFYFFGCGGMIVYILWLLLVYNSPAVHPCIKEEEREYIESVIPSAMAKKLEEEKGKERKQERRASLQEEAAKVQGRRASLQLMRKRVSLILPHSRKLPVPWFDIVKSLPVWAIAIAHSCHNWGVYMLLTSLPKYMAQVLKFDIKTNGLLSATPYIVQLVAILLGSRLVDFIIQHQLLSTTAMRKLVQIIGFLGQATFMVAAGFIHCSQKYLAVGLITTSVAFSCGTHFGALINHVDIAPRYAGILFGISNTIASMMGIVAPIVVAQLTPNGEREEWQKVFYITGAISLFGAIVYGLFASGVEQEWAKDPWVQAFPSGLKGAVLPSGLDNNGFEKEDDNKGFEKEDDSVPATFEPKPPIQEHQYDTRF